MLRQQDASLMSNNFGMTYLLISTPNRVDCRAKNAKSLASNVLFKSLLYTIRALCCFFVKASKPKSTALSVQSAASNLFALLTGLKNELASVRVCVEFHVFGVSLCLAPRSNALQLTFAYFLQSIPVVASSHLLEQVLIVVQVDGLVDFLFFLFKSLFHVGNKYSISYIYLYKITNKIQLINE